MNDPGWCPEHGRLECTHPRHGGRTCHGSAVRGTAACRMHLGKSVAQARREVLTAWAAVPDDTGISPRAAVAGQLGVAWRRAELLGEALRQQAESSSGNGDGAAGTGGLVGHRYSASEAAGGIYPTAEQARALVEIEAAERDRVVRFGKVAHEMGVEEARVRLAEEEGAVMSAILASALRRLGVDPGDAAVRAAVHAELLAVVAARGDGA